MTEHGLERVDAAKADGRWQRAYQGGKEMTIPADLQAAIDAEPKAKAMLATFLAKARLELPEGEVPVPIARITLRPKQGLRLKVTMLH